LDAALVPYPLEKDKLRAPFHCLLIRTGSHTVLVDTGLGSGRGATAGHLIANLAAAGIAPGEIDFVVLSHLHGDHVGGALDAESRPAFPRARYVLSEAEWAFWQSEAAPVQANKTAAQAARVLLETLRPVLDRIAPPAELLPGVQIISVPGHTPGQIALRLTSEGQQLIYTADVIAQPLHLAPRPSAPAAICWTRPPPISL
jgi:glyoxylase-like metal-dependent hydrolase (beta-lactamase superfamily II)